VRIVPPPRPDNVVRLRLTAPTGRCSLTLRPSTACEPRNGPIDTTTIGRRCSRTSSSSTAGVRVSDASALMCARLGPFLDNRAGMPKPVLVMSDHHHLDPHLDVKLRCLLAEGRQLPGGASEKIEGHETFGQVRRSTSMIQRRV